MIERVEKYREEGKTIGGSVYFEAQGVPPGLGAPRFDGLPARLGKVMMGTHAVTAFEFGQGKEARETHARERNDELGLNEDGKIRPIENDIGGMQGGISNGKPIYGEVTIHAPTSTGDEQQTIDWKEGNKKKIVVGGRHDPVLPPRHVPIIEANLALTLVDFMMLSGRINPDRMDDNPGEYDTDYHPEEI
jgi:chorismate synthase